MEIAPRIHRLGEGLVNSYLVAARVVLPWHGQPRNGVAAAIARVRQEVARG
jgi:hypothetical protein